MQMLSLNEAITFIMDFNPW